MKTRNHLIRALLVVFFGGLIATGVNAQTLVGSFAVDDGPVWTTNPPTYSCLEACAQVFGGVAGDYSCSTSSTAIDHQAFADGWGDNQYCSTPVAETFKVNTSYDCGSTGCSYSAYVSDHSCGAVNYCYAAVASRPVPVMGEYGLPGLLALSLLLVLAAVFGIRRHYRRGM